jgi:hypothetical protein
MPRPSTTTASKSAVARSRVSNGKSLFLEPLDGRGVLARRFRDLVQAMTDDLGGGEILSEAQRQLVRRAAALSVECERLELEMASGRKVDFTDYGQLTNALGRVVGRLGIKRVAKDSTLDLKAYLSARHPAHEAAE